MFLLRRFQKWHCYSCCYTPSKQDVLGFSFSQRPGPPTQTVYLRVKLNLCDYGLLTSYRPPPQRRFWQPHWAPWQKSHTLISAQFALMVLGSFFGNLPVSNWLRASCRGICRYLKSTYQIKVHCTVLACACVCTLGCELSDMFSHLSFIRHESMLFMTLWQLM